MTTETDTTPVRRAPIAIDIVAAFVCVALVAFAWRMNRTWFELHLTQSFCAQNPKQLHRLMAVRVGAVLLAAFLALVVRPLLKKWLSGRTPRDALAAAARIAGAIVLALVVSMLFLRSKKDMSATLPPPALPPLRPDPEMGWVGVGNVDVTLRADDREIPYSFNADGYRVSSRDALVDYDAPSILFAGESITEGIGVRWEEAYPAAVAKDLNVQPVEVAVHGYGSDSIYLETKKMLPRLAHPIAVVTLMIPQLLERDFDPTRPRLTLGPDGSFVTVPPAPPMSDWWRDSPLRKLARGLFPYHDDSSIELTRALFRATAKDARARGAYPLFVWMNWGFPCLPEDAGTPSLHDRVFQGLDVPSIEVHHDPLEEEHSTYHPNAKAHRQIADAIEKALIEAKVVTK